MESSHGQLTQTRLQFGYLIRRWWIANRRRVVLVVERHKRIKNSEVEEQSLGTLLVYWPSELYIP